MRYSCLWFICRAVESDSLGSVFSQILFSELSTIFCIRNEFLMQKILKRFRKGVWGITLLQKGFPQLPDRCIIITISYPLFPE